MWILSTSNDTYDFVETQLWKLERHQNLVVNEVTSFSERKRQRQSERKDC